MLHVLTKNTKCHQPFTGKWTKLQILLIERVLRLTERDYTHWKGLVVLTCEYGRSHTTRPKMADLTRLVPKWQISHGASNVGSISPLYIMILLQTHYTLWYNSKHTIHYDITPNTLYIMILLQTHYTLWYNSKHTIHYDITPDTLYIMILLQTHNTLWYYYRHTIHYDITPDTQYIMILLQTIYIKWLLLFEVSCVFAIDHNLNDQMSDVVDYIYMWMRQLAASWHYR